MTTQEILAAKWKQEKGMIEFGDGTGEEDCLFIGSRNEDLAAHIVRCHNERAEKDGKISLLELRIVEMERLIVRLQSERAELVTALEEAQLLISVQSSATLPLNTLLEFRRLLDKIDDAIAREAKEGAK
jgi:hypothetical protein